ncbi:hypothetical protein [Stappia sp. ES.058]|uniref:hypothetical protein n=1 Tax=Stappia sp. ES.058 TaxID=1881061 RepID=UPI000B895D8E|nr:hypothetical protein [Stappia sp. ES.058]
MTVIEQGGDSGNPGILVRFSKAHWAFSARRDIVFVIGFAIIALSMPVGGTEMILGTTTWIAFS